MLNNANVRDVTCKTAADVWLLGVVEIAVITGVCCVVAPCFVVCTCCGVVFAVFVLDVPAGFVDAPSAAVLDGAVLLVVVKEVEGEGKEEADDAGCVVMSSVLVAVGTQLPAGSQL